MKNIILLLLCILSLHVFAGEFPEPMQPRRLVNDFTGLFSAQETAMLENKLRRFNDTTSTQIAIATVSTLHDYTPNDYAQRLAAQWRIGQKGKNNGILLLIKPKKGNEKGQVAIAVGYGLEGAVPDVIASRIIRNVILPAFRNGQYYTGVNQATDLLMQYTTGEFKADSRKKDGIGAGWILLPFLVVILVPLLVRRHSSYTAGSHSDRSDMSGGGFFPPIFFGGFGSGRSSGGFDSFSSGSGIFGGFGGGDFGGGGASGDW